MLEVIKDPLTHMVRNSADHGIESRRTARPRASRKRARSALNAYHEGGTITIEITDDGSGLDYAAIRARPLERGIVSEAEARAHERRADRQASSSMPGFSTAEPGHQVSGRGVGMDVVRTNIEQIGGTVEIRSEQGRGTDLHDQDPADARHRRGADRLG